MSEASETGFIFGEKLLLFESESSYFLRQEFLYIDVYFFGEKFVEREGLHSRRYSVGTFVVFGRTGSCGGEPRQGGKFPSNCVIHSFFQMESIERSNHAQITD